MLRTTSDSSAAAEGKGPARPPRVITLDEIARRCAEYDRQASMDQASAHRTFERATQRATGPRWHQISLVRWLLTGLGCLLLLGVSPTDLDWLRALAVLGLALSTMMVSATLAEALLMISIADLRSKWRDPWG